MASVRKSLLWSYASQTVTLGVTFATSVVVTRLLSPVDMGIYALALAISGVLGVFLSFGTQAYLVREAELDPRVVRSAFTVNLMLSGVLALCLFAAGAIEWWLDQQALATVFLIMGFGPLLSALEFVPATLFMREMRYGVISLLTVVRVLVTSSVTLGLVFGGAGVPGLAAGPVVANLVCALLYMALRPRDLIFRPGLYQFRAIAVFGVQMLSISGVAQVASRGSDILLGSMLGLAALGLYARASSLSALVFVNVYGLATGVIFAKLSRDLRETGEIHHSFVRALRMITGVMWPMLIGLAIVAGPVVQLLYGRRWLPAATPLSLLMIAQFVVLGFGMNWELFVLRNETARQTRIEIVRAMVGTAIFAIGCLFGIAAAALGRIGEAVVGYLLYRPHIDRLAGTSQGEIGGIYRESLLLTIAATLPVALTMLSQRWSPDVPIAWIAAATALGGVGWALLLWRREHPIFEEVRLLLVQLRR